MLRVIRTNYEVYIDHFKCQILQQLISRRLGKDRELLQENIKSEVDSIRDDVFEVVTAFTPVLKLLTKAIPLGLKNEEDQKYAKQCREDLFDCTLMLFRNVNVHL